jgi:hypothetical protein
MNFDTSGGEFVALRTIVSLGSQIPAYVWNNHHSDIVEATWQLFAEAI